MPKSRWELIASMTLSRACAAVGSPRSTPQLGLIGRRTMARGWSLLWVNQIGTRDTERSTCATEPTLVGKKGIIVAWPDRGRAGWCTFYFVPTIVEFSRNNHNRVAAATW